MSEECLGSGNHGDVVATIQGSLCLGGLLCQAELLNIADHCAQHLLGKRRGSCLHGGHRSDDLRHVAGLDGCQSVVNEGNQACSIFCPVFHGISLQVLQVLGSHGLCSGDDLLHGSGQFLRGDIFLSKCSLSIGVGSVQRLFVESRNNGTKIRQYFAKVSLDGSFQRLGSLGH